MSRKGIHSHKSRDSASHNWQM